MAQTEQTVRPVHCGPQGVMMSTAIDPHLIVVCNSKAGHHLRTTVRELTFQLNQVILQIGLTRTLTFKKGGRTPRPRGGSSVMLDKRSETELRSHGNKRKSLVLTLRRGLTR